MKYIVVVGLYVYLFITIQFRPGCYSYLTSKPKHVTRAVGENVTFNCSSDTGYIKWHYVITDKTGSVLQAIYSNGTVQGRGRSSVAAVDSVGNLLISFVGKSDVGMYRCEDEQEAAYARLEVLESSVNVRLSLSPADVVAKRGETVVLRAAQTTVLLRWYRTLAPVELSSRQKRKTIYTGREMDYKQVDSRFQVLEDRDGERSLVIRNIQSKDAGVYTARDVINEVEVSANITVIDPDASGILLNSFNSHEIKIRCSASYRGTSAPAIRWNWPKDRQTADAARFIPTHATVRVGHRQLTRARELIVSLKDSDAVWPTACQISFSLYRCSELSSTYTLTFPVRRSVTGVDGNLNASALSVIDAVNVLIADKATFTIIIILFLALEILLLASVAEIASSC